MKNERTDEEMLCPLRYVLNIIGGKWKLPILCILADGNPKRYSEIKKRIPDITNMMLSQSLKELESYSMVDRKQYNQIPPKVEYTLSPDVRELLQPLGLLAKWGTNHMEESRMGNAACGTCKAHDMNITEETL